MVCCIFWLFKNLKHFRGPSPADRELKQVTTATGHGLTTTAHNQTVRVPERFEGLRGLNAGPMLRLIVQSTDTYHVRWWTNLGVCPRKAHLSTYKRSNINRLA